MSIIFFGMGHASLEAREHSPDALLREWDVAERKTFIIALYYVRSFLVNRDNAQVSLQVNLCQLKNFLKILVRREYYTYKRYRKNESSIGLTQECKQYKRFLVLTCLTYYLLMYISRFYSRETSLAFIQYYETDSFLHTFFHELSRKVDFIWYDQESCCFNLNPLDQSLLCEYPKKFSFRVLGFIFLVEKTDPTSILYETMKKLMKRVFLFVSVAQYLKSYKNFEQLKEELSEM